MVSDLLRSIADLGEVRDRAETIVEVPEWNTRIRFLTPTLARLIELERERAKLDDSPESRVESLLLPIAYSAVDEDGAEIFFAPEGRDWLRARNCDVILRLGKTAAKVCGANPDQVDEAMGESEGTPDSESASA